MFADFLKYLQTPEFRLALYDKVVGAAFNLLFLSLLLPLIVWLIRRKRSARLRFTLRFYFFQVFHKLVDIHLKLASIKDPMGRLMQALKEKKLSSVGGPASYGNLENKFWLFGETITTGELRREIRNRTVDEVRDCVTLSAECVKEIDQLATWVASSPRLFEVVMTVRLLAYGLRDQLSGIAGAAGDEGRRSYHEYQLVSMAQSTRMALEGLFRQERKHVDGLASARHRAMILRLFANHLYSRARWTVENTLAVVAGRPKRGKGPVEPSS